MNTKFFFLTNVVLADSRQFFASGEHYNIWSEWSACSQSCDEGIKSKRCLTSLGSLCGEIRELCNVKPCSYEKHLWVILTLVASFLPFSVITLFAVYKVVKRFRKRQVVRAGKSHHENDRNSRISQLSKNFQKNNKITNNSGIYQDSFEQTSLKRLFKKRSPSQLSSELTPTSNKSRVYRLTSSAVRGKNKDSANTNSGARNALSKSRSQTKQDSSKNDLIKEGTIENNDIGLSKDLFTKSNLVYQDTFVEEVENQIPKELEKVENEKKTYEDKQMQESKQIDYFDKQQKKFSNEEDYLKVKRNRSRQRPDILSETSHSNQELNDKVSASKSSNSRYIQLNKDGITRSGNVGRESNQLQKSRYDVFDNESNVSGSKSSREDDELGKCKHVKHVFWCKKTVDKEPQKRTLSRSSEQNFDLSAQLINKSRFLQSKIFGSGEYVEECLRTSKSQVFNQTPKVELRKSNISKECTPDYQIFPAYPYMCRCSYGCCHSRYQCSPHSNYHMTQSQTQEIAVSPKAPNSNAESASESSNDIEIDLCFRPQYGCSNTYNHCCTCQRYSCIGTRKNENLDTSREINSCGNCERDNYINEKLEMLNNLDKRFARVFNDNIPEHSTAISLPNYYERNQSVSNFNNNDNYNVCISSQKDGKIYPCNNNNTCRDNNATTSTRQTQNAIDNPGDIYCRQDVLDNCTHRFNSNCDKDANGSSDCKQISKCNNLTSSICIQSSRCDEDMDSKRHQFNSLINQSNSITRSNILIPKLDLSFLTDDETIDQSSQRYSLPGQISGCPRLVSTRDYGYVGNNTSHCQIQGSNKVDLLKMNDPDKFNIMSSDGYLKDHSFISSVSEMYPNSIPSRTMKPQNIHGIGDTVFNSRLPNAHIVHSTKCSEKNNVISRELRSSDSRSRFRLLPQFRSPTFIGNNKTCLSQIANTNVMHRPMKIKDLNFQSCSSHKRMQAGIDGHLLAGSNNSKNKSNYCPQNNLASNSLITPKRHKFSMMCADNTHPMDYSNKIQCSKPSFQTINNNLNIGNKNELPGGDNNESISHPNHVNEAIDETCGNPEIQTLLGKHFDLKSAKNYVKQLFDKYR